MLNNCELLNFKFYDVIIMSGKSISDTIASVYYDKSGFGSIRTTFQDAKKQDKRIKLDDVNDWFKTHVEYKKKMAGYNSYIAPRAHYEYQLDLFFITDLNHQKYKVGMIMIDVFSKYMTVVPVMSKSEGDLAAGMLECFVKMGSKPEILYTDDETALNTVAVQTYLQERNIKHIITRSHAHFAERAIRTFKDALYKRVENSKEDNVQWTDFVFEILLTYNNKLVHSSTGFTPADARKKQNELMVKASLILNSNHTRKYPELNVGDKVKMFRKKTIREKERTSYWSENVYEIIGMRTSMGQTVYKLSGLDREYMRHELLKIG